MQRKHERILAKTLNCYRQQMEELANAVSSRQKDADDNQGRLAAAARKLSFGELASGGEANDYEGPIGAGGYVV